jgi:hypothetical protein
MVRKLAPLAQLLPRQVSTLREVVAPALELAG